MAAETRILIERYEDQRLYDVELERYLTIEDLVAWLAMSLRFEVRDAKSGDDVTDVLLAQARGDPTLKAEPARVEPRSQQR